MASDAGEILDDDMLYRRIVPFHVKDATKGIVSSSAYMLSKPDKGPDPKASVNLKRLTTIEETLRQAPHPGFCIGEISVRELRALGLTVDLDKIPGNDAHCVIRGLKTKDDCRRLAEITHIIYQPPAMSA